MSESIFPQALATTPAPRRCRPAMAWLGVVVLALAGCVAQEPPETEAPVTERYVNDAYGYGLEYPADYETRQIDQTGRVFEHDGVTLQTRAVSAQGRSLSAIAAGEFDRPDSASALEHDGDGLLLVADGDGRTRSVQAIALGDGRVGLLVIEGDRIEAVRARQHTVFTALAASEATEEAYERFTDRGLGVSLRYPEDARVDRDSENRVAFTVLGPNNRADSELIDGFVLTVVRDQSALADSLATYGEIRRPPSATPIRQVQIAESTALRFTADNALGLPATHLLFEPAPERFYDVNYAISGDPAVYRRRIDTMLDSLRFLD